MTKLRMKRLLHLAGRAIDYKHLYSQYYPLINQGYVRWTMGFASLTTMGKDKLKELQIKG